MSDRNEKKKEEHKQFERLRKRRQQGKKKNNVSKNDGRAGANVKTGQICRKQNKKATEQEVKKLKMKVKMFSNKFRRLKRKLNSTPQNEDLQDVSSSCSDTSSTQLYR